jgi:phage baseplate assembly protein W
MAIGLTFPLAKSTGSVGFLEMTSDQLSAATNNLRSLLLTNWGERVCHFYFGCNLREFLFENFRNDEIRAKIAARILQQVETWLPFISVDNLNVADYSNDNSIPQNAFVISISFSLKYNPSLSSRFQVIVD